MERPFGTEDVGAMQTPIQSAGSLRARSVVRASTRTSEFWTRFEWMLDARCAPQVVLGARACRLIARNIGAAAVRTLVASAKLDLAAHTVVPRSVGLDRYDTLAAVLFDVDPTGTAWNREGLVDTRQLRKSTDTIA
jgi:hypothetical protein